MARLDHILVADNLLTLNYILKSSILLWAGSDNRLISLSISQLLYLGPIPFQFSPLWLESPNFLEMVSLSWAGRIDGSPTTIWESNIRRLKDDIKNWLKDHQSERQNNIKDLEGKLASIQGRMEIILISESNLRKEA